MSKQEVIEEIYRAFNPQLHDGYRLKTAERIYDRIAPLREFPEEGVLQELQWLYSAGSLDGINKDQSDATIKYKVNMALRVIRQLCEGQPRTTKGDNVLEQEGRYDTDKAKNRARSRVLKIAQDKPKGTCGKCGGSKRVPDYDNIDQKLGTIYTKDCPDCGGTGKSEKCCRLASCTRPAQKQMGCIYCPECIANRRIGKERRKVLGRRDYDERCRRSGIIPTALHGGKLDRRKPPDRRKAVSDDAKKARTWPHSRR